VLHFFKALEDKFDSLCLIGQYIRNVSFFPLYFRLIFSVSYWIFVLWGLFVKLKDLAFSLRYIRKSIKAWPIPAVTAISFEQNAFKVLVSCLLSLRTRDEVTYAASKRLFDLARSPKKLLHLNPEQIEKAIYPVAFYRNKTLSLYEICRSIVYKNKGKVPDSLDKLLSLKGVGRKTANLTLVLGFNKLGICVDIHVHRIMNRWGFVKTKSPDDTELELRQKLPRRYWMEINNLLVSFGQNICKPQSPYCSKCGILEYCEQVGVTRYR
jgi:endonuclease III